MFISRSCLPFFCCLLCTSKVFLPLNCFCPSIGVLPKPPTSLSATQLSPLPYVGRATFHSHSKEFFFFSCSSWHSHPYKGLAFSLSNSYGMQLVISAHLSLFWVASHPSKTFPPKGLKREPQNRFPPFLPQPPLTARPYPLLPLTHGPPLLYWLGTCG